MISPSEEIHEVVTQKPRHLHYQMFDIAFCCEIHADAIVLSSEKTDLRVSTNLAGGESFFNECW